MAEAAQTVTESLKVEFCGILMPGTDGKMLALHATAGWNEQVLGRLTVVNDPGSAAAGYALARESPLVITELAREQRFTPPKPLLRLGVKSGLCIAIGGATERYGVMTIFTTRQRRFDQTEISFAQTTGDILALAIRSDLAAAREREIARNEAKFRTVFERSIDAISILSLDKLQYLDLNDAFSNLLGYEHSELLGKTPVEAGVLDSQDKLDDMYRILTRDGEVRNFEVEMCRKDGDRIAVLLSSVVVELEGRAMGLTFLRDITARKQTEAELAKARDAALEASRLKSAFLANTSHEIRTPLNIILGYSDLIAEHLADIGDNSQEPYIEAVERAGKRLLQTIEGIVEYSRIEAGTLALRKVAIQLAPFVEGVVNDLGEMARAKGLSVDCRLEAPDAVVMFDRHSLKSALVNLLQNAIKFTDKGQIAVRLYCDSDGAMNLEVRDSGVGIDPNYLPKLFEAFSQEESSRTRKYEGTGLGLALARRHLILNGAELSVTTQKGVGTTFTIHFPKSSLVHPEPTSVPSARILVVEDDPDMQGYIRTALAGEYAVTVAASSREAYRELEAAPAELVLMDLTLRGGESGLALTRNLRADPRWKNIAIVALTAYVAAGDRDGALAAGCDAYLAKPVDRRALLATIAALLGQKRATD